MSKRKLNPAQFGYTEAQWAALDPDTRLRYQQKAYYLRNRDRIIARQLAYLARKAGKK